MQRNIKTSDGEGKGSEESEEIIAKTDKNPSTHMANTVSVACLEEGEPALGMRWHVEEAGVRGWGRVLEPAVVPDARRWEVQQHHVLLVQVDQLFNRLIIRYA